MVGFPRDISVCVPTSGRLFFLLQTKTWEPSDPLPSMPMDISCVIFQGGYLFIMHHQDWKHRFCVIHHGNLSFVCWYSNGSFVVNVQLLEKMTASVRRRDTKIQTIVDLVVSCT